MIKRKKLRGALAAFVVCAAACVVAPARASAQADAAGDVKSTGAQADAGAKNSEGGLKLTPGEESLVRGSKAAIIATGFSEAFFDAHFEPFRVFDSPGDRRVLWRFRVNDYETFVSDPVGFYTDARGRRVDTHTVGATLGKTRDIRRTISRRRAERLMKDCIGEYQGGTVTYQRIGVDNRAALVFSALTVTTTTTPAGASAGSAQPPPSAPSPSASELESRLPDAPKKRGKKKPFIGIGTVDLETGRCTKGVARAGSPHPRVVAPPASKGTPRRRR